jgi:hypothetical protein
MYSNAYARALHHAFAVGSICATPAGQRQDVLVPLDKVQPELNFVGKVDRIDDRGKRDLEGISLRVNLIPAEGRTVWSI